MGPVADRSGMGVDADGTGPFSGRLDLAGTVNVLESLVRGNPEGSRSQWPSSSTNTSTDCSTRRPSTGRRWPTWLPNWNSPVPATLGGERSRRPVYSNFTVTNSVPICPQGRGSK